MALLQITEMKWRKMIQEFINKISDTFGSRLVSFIASYDPNVTVNDYNVVIVLDKVSDEDWKVVRRIARDLEETLGVEITIVPAVTKKGSLLEEKARSIFLNPYDLKMWSKIIKGYEEEISRYFGSRLISFIASYDPNVTVNDYNVVIVLDKVSDEDWKVVRRIARDLEETLGVEITIVPAVTKKGSLLEEEAQNVFGKSKKVY